MLLDRKMVISFFSLLVIPSLLFANGGNGFIINGKLGGLIEGEKILLLIVDKGTSSQVIDSTFSTKGRFELHGYISEAPRFVALRFSKHPELNLYYFILDNEEVNINGFISQNLNQSIAINNNTQQSRVVFEGVLNMYNYVIDNLRNFSLMSYIDTKNGYSFKSEDSIKNALRLMGGIESGKELLDDFIMRSFIEKGNDLLVPFLFEAYYNYIGYSYYFPSLYKKLNSKIQESYYGKLMRKKLYLCIGNPAPDFDFTLFNGEIRCLKNVVKENKITIIDFWASYCAPCRTEFKANLIDLYQKYSKHGLNIIGISADTDERKWRHTIQEDKLPWMQSCSLKGQFDPIIELFGIEHLPSNVLINESGKIIAWNIMGIELKWYLNKMFGENDKE